MSEHTKEPWQLFGVDLHIMGNTLEQAKEQGVPHTQWTHNCPPEDARRIVACVNACAGIPTERLEWCNQSDAKAMVDLMLKWKDQRDELRSVLKLPVEWDRIFSDQGAKAADKYLTSKGWDGRMSPDQFFEQKRDEAIAKAEAA
jgi:hypothetical protein